VERSLNSQAVTISHRHSSSSTTMSPICSMVFLVSLTTIAVAIPPPKLADPVPVPACGRTAFSPPSETSAAYVTSVANFPWAAAVYKVRSEGVKKRLVCGGTVISDRWILTGATCVRNWSGSATLSVRLRDLHLQEGSWDANPTSPPFDLDIVKVVQHPEYKWGQNIAHDMALLKTETAITFSSTVSPICLPKPSQTSAVPTGSTLIFAGWGKGPLGKGPLKWAKLMVVDQASCRAISTTQPMTTTITTTAASYNNNSQVFGPVSFCTTFEPTDTFHCGVSLGDEGSVLMNVVDEGGVKTWYAVGLPAGGDRCASQPKTNLALAPSMDWVSSVIAMG